MTNLEKIRQINVAELISKLNESKCAHCNFRDTNKCYLLDHVCKRGIESWLNSEGEE